jgi:transposase
MFKNRSLPKQDDLWIRTSELIAAHKNPFYDSLKKMLNEIKFGDQVRKLCSEHYVCGGPGQPGVDPEVYFKMLIIAFFQNIASEREIERRCHDSLSIREFLGYDLTERVPDHTTLSVIRLRLSAETFTKVFQIMHPVLQKHGLIIGENIGMDTSVTEANASMRALRNRLTEEEYRQFVERLAKENGVDPSDPAAVSRFDRKRKKKVSNEELENPHDPDAKIGPTKHGTIRMIYKPEHTVDMDTGAILDAQVQPGDMADCTDVTDRVMNAEMIAAEGLNNGEMDLPIKSFTSDKGYHTDDEIVELSDYDIKVNIPDRLAKRNLDKMDDTKRERIENSMAFVASDEGKELLRKRGMYIERSFAHVLDSGGMRRTTPRGQENIQKRYIIAAMGFNISLVMGKIFGYGTPKQYDAGNETLLFLFFSKKRVLIWLYFLSECFQGEFFTYVCHN